MSRFGNLEFNSRQQGESQQPHSVLKDERHYLAEGQSACARGDFEKALTYFSRALEYNPMSAAAWSWQVRVMIEQEDMAAARAWVDKGLERLRDDPELLAAKAVTLARVGELDVALAFSDAALAERGETSYLWLARGDVLLARAEAHAEFCFSRALALAPQDWFIRWLAARIHYFYRHFTQALMYAQQALALGLDRSVTWLVQGHCQQALGLIGPARDSFLQARQLDPRNPEIALVLARLAQVGMLTRLQSAWRQIFQR